MISLMKETQNTNKIQNKDFNRMQGIFVKCEKAQEMEGRVRYKKEEGWKKELKERKCK